MGAKIVSLLQLVTQFCIINRPALEEHLRELIKEIKAIINSPSIFSTKLIYNNYNYKKFQRIYERIIKVYYIRYLIR